MKNIASSITRVMLILICTVYCTTGKADNVNRGWLRPYVSGRGLAFYYSSDSIHWDALGHGRTFVDSDFGTWGAEKKMADPCLYRTDDGLWTLMWIPNPKYDQYAICTSPDLIHWKPQDYPTLTPAISQLMEEKRSDAIKVDWSLIESLKQRCDYLDARDKKYAESLRQDNERFADLKPLDVRLTFDANDTKAISDKLIGIFFEDISYGADGGLYAELIQNRDFEYAKGENGHIKEWGTRYNWTVEGDGLVLSINTDDPIHPNNPHYLTLAADGKGSTLSNNGYDGIAIAQGETYDFSLFARKGAKELKMPDVKLEICIQAEDGSSLASTRIKISNTGWKQFHASLKATGNASAARLVIKPLNEGYFDIDMVSLFPRHTFMNRPNGLRADLAQAIADIHPKFVRFPGGCVAHGNGLDNMYLWKNTIGKLEERKPMSNIWNYHQSFGLGYYEYFQFCEDIGAEPLPVLPAGVPCQNSSKGGPGQQGGVPMEQMEAFTQDILDLIEWANGDARTTHWGKIRAQSGHPKPFGLKYIGIGNEDLISYVFTERFTYIYNKVHAQYPDIIICGTVGPFYEGSDYDWGWKLATELGVPMVDEHYYVSPGWMIHNQDFYDHYDRSKPHVYLGEYAAHVQNRSNCMESALCEALYLTNVERNADIVDMTSYAPLLCREGHSNWNPDMIYFNGTDIRLTPGYYVQKMFGNNSGDHYVSGMLKSGGKPLSEDVRRRLSFSCVTDSQTGDIILKFANLLPVQVSASLDGLYPDTEGTEVQANVTTLSGKPNDTHAELATAQLSIADGNVTFDPYSFTVIRISQKPNESENR